MKDTFRWVFSNTYNKIQQLNLKTIEYIISKVHSKKDVGIGVRDVRIGAKDVGIGVKDVRIGAKDVGIGVRDVGIGARDIRIKNSISGDYCLKNKC